MNDDDYGLSIFLLAFAVSLFFICFIAIVYPDLGLMGFLLCSLFVVSCLLGIFTSKHDYTIKSWRVIIATTNDGVYYLGRGLSWYEAKKLRDGTVEDFESKGVMLSVRCTNSNGRVGVRNFVKSNIVHIGWLVD